MTEKFIESEFDRLFDEGMDTTPYIVKGSVRAPNMETRKVNVDLPVWMITQLDREATRLSIPRQAVIKIMIDEGLERRGMGSEVSRYAVGRARATEEAVAMKKDTPYVMSEDLIDRLIDERLARREAQAAQDVKEG